MIHRHIWVLFLLFATGLSAQFVNNGATITIQAGATLRVETDFVNNTGTVTNSGTLEVEGDFVNTATFTSTNPSLVRFINAGQSDVTSGGAVLRNVEMAKTAGNNVALLSGLAIAGDLNFTADNNRLVLGNNNLTMLTGATITSADANEYVATNGTGRLVKSVGGNTTVTHEVGDMANYSPTSSVVTGSSYTSATLGVRAVSPAVTTKYVGTSDYINREWQVVASGIGTYANTVTGTYVAGDVTGMTSLIKGATYYSGDWHFEGSAGAASTVTASTTTNDVILSGKNFFGKVNLRAFLAGAFNSGSMTTTINSILPLSSPYSAAPFNAPAVTAISIPGTATDWILIEVRDAVTPSTVISQTSGFILSNGNIVNIDGTPLKLKNAVPNAHIALRHRNHLAIRTNSTLDLLNPIPLFDFSTSTSQAFTNAAYPASPYENANMRLMSGGVYAMWGGNVNSNTNVRYAGPSNDNSALLTALGNDRTVVLGSPPPLVYNTADLNLNGVVRYAGPANDNGILLQNLDNDRTKVYTSHQ